MHKDTESLLCIFYRNSFLYPIDIDILLNDLYNIINIHINITIYRLRSEEVHIFYKTVRWRGREEDEI